MGNRVYSIIVALAVVTTAALYWQGMRQHDVEKLSSYEDCVKAGNPVQESYPPRCTTFTGQVFTQDIGNELEMADLIKITAPRPTEDVTSPLEITGMARGPYFFEGSFQASIINDRGEILGSTTVMSDGEWMTMDFVPFTGTITFDPKDAAKGELILEKSNPSGLLENSGRLIVPVRFK